MGEALCRLRTGSALLAFSAFGVTSTTKMKKVGQGMITLSADTLFRSIGGVSNRAYRELVAPLLHVLPMTPGYDCSAAAALSCFHTFALQSRGAFDVRWCKGSISSDLIFNSWATKLQRAGNARIDGSSKVTLIKEINSDGNKSLRLRSMERNGSNLISLSSLLERSHSRDFSHSALSFRNTRVQISEKSTWNNMRCCSTISETTNLKKW